MKYITWGILLILVLSIISGCSCNGSSGSSDVAGMDLEVVRYCNGEVGRYEAWDKECIGNVGCSERVLSEDSGCHCTLCRGEECVRIGCGETLRDGGVDTGEDVFDAGCDKDIKIYPDIPEPDCTFEPDLEGREVDFIDLDKPINELGWWLNVFLNDNNDLLFCEEDPPAYSCKRIYHINLDERPLRMRKIPTCDEDDHFIWGQALCNGKDYILFPLRVKGYNMGLIEYNKRTGEVRRIKTPEDIYSAEELYCQDDNILVYRDAPNYYDCEGIIHLVNYFFYFNRQRGIHKRIKLPMESFYNKYEKYYVEKDISTYPFVWGEYVVYDDPMEYIDKPEYHNCFWRYNIETDNSDIFFCLNKRYETTSFNYRINEYRLVFVVYSEESGYEPGIWIVNVKTGEKTYIPEVGPIDHAIPIYKNLMTFYRYDDKVYYIYDLDTKVKRKIDGVDGIQFMNNKYFVTTVGTSNTSYWTLVDMEKLGIVKDGHVVPE